MDLNSRGHSVEPVSVTLRDVESALDVVREVAHRTPTVPFGNADRGDLLLKLENLQRLGAFKIRGAWNRMTRLSEAERNRGVTTISSGNHGYAVAWAARRLGLRCRVRVPEGAAARKVENIRSQGAEVVPMPRADLVRAYEEELWRSWPESFIHPFAHAHVIAGQGTIGWEVADDVPDVRTVLVPVGGGGLSSGIAIAVKGRVPAAKVYGVQAEGAAPLRSVFETRKPARVDMPRTIADGIGIGMILPAMVRLLLQNLDGCFVVNDADITAAMRELAVEGRVVAEPAGAAAFAAWRRYREQLVSPVAAIVSGGNVDPAFFADVLRTSAQRR